MSIHRGTKEFAADCPECGKTFNDKGYLSSHLKIHRWVKIDRKWVKNFESLHSQEQKRISLSLLSEILQSKSSFQHARSDSSRIKTSCLYSVWQTVFTKNAFEATLPNSCKEFLQVERKRFLLKKIFKFTSEWWKTLQMPTCWMRKTIRWPFKYDSSQSIAQWSQTFRLQSLPEKIF